MSSEQVDLRPARPDDVARLVDVYRRAYGLNADLGFPSSVTTIDADRVRGWIDERSVFVATLGTEIVGVVQLFSREDWPVPELGRFAVDPDYHQRGIGTRLLRFAEDRARSDGFDRIRLRTFTDHPFLGEWYRSNGYERIGTRELDGRPYDLSIMERAL